MLQVNMQHFHTLLSRLVQRPPNKPLDGGTETCEA